jgi:hypothetical protein
VNPVDKSVSPYLLQPLRSFEQAKLEREQRQRAAAEAAKQPQPVPAAPAAKPGPGRIDQSV